MQRRRGGCTNQEVHVGELVLGPLELEVVAKGDQEIRCAVCLRPILHKVTHQQ
jgi:hypothetical protein